MKIIQIKYLELSQSEIVIKRIILSFGIKIEIFQSSVILKCYLFLGNQVYFLFLDWYFSEMCFHTDATPMAHLANQIPSESLSAYLSATSTETENNPFLE